MRPIITRRAAFAHLRRICAIFVLPLLAILPTPSHADTVASLLGNFTINQFCALALDDVGVRVRYTVVFGQLPALRELHEADSDGDGVTSQAERDAYAKRLAPAFAEQLALVVDGTRIPLIAMRTTTSLPTEQGGFSLRLDVDLTGRLPESVADGAHTLHFANQNYPGRFGWQEIVVEPSQGISVFATNAFRTSLTADLTEALATLPPSGPLVERVVQLSFTHGAPPSGATLIPARPETHIAPTVASAPAPVASGGNWLAVKTRELVKLISAPHVAPTIALLALLAAVMVGALHAFSPGHGKTIVGAYLIGSRATLLHAVFLGATVTITHTLGVFALGFATLFASRFVVPERLLPALSLISGLLVLGLGIVLTVRRLPAARDAWSKRSPLRATTAYRIVAQQPHGKAQHGFVMAYADAHHSADHRHHHVHALMHSHGGRMHSHLPPGGAGEAVTWKSLLALGVSGGLVPCPSAMVLLLAAIALNKTAFGLALVLAFSVGLAMTLIAVGFVFLYARNRLRRPVANTRFARLLPVASAAFITVVGALLCYGALAGAPI